MGRAKNILFIMFDQLRWDYLSCAGHPHLHTPNIDALAEEGVRFTHAYCQSPVCGASRMSFYTGRYCHSHGATWNRVPLKVGEHTLGDHLRDNGMDCWLVGKTHMKADTEGMARLAPTPKALEQAAKAPVLTRLGAKEEVADLAAFLASDHAAYITGTIVPCDGGLGLVGLAGLGG